MFVCCFGDSQQFFALFGETVRLFMNMIVTVSTQNGDGKLSVSTKTRKQNGVALWGSRQFHCMVKNSDVICVSLQ